MEEVQAFLGSKELAAAFRRHISSFFHFCLAMSRLSARQHSLMLATSQTHQSLSTRFDELEVELQVRPDKIHPATSSHACFFQSMVSRFVQKGSDKHF